MFKVKSTGLLVCILLLTLAFSSCGSPDVMPAGGPTDMIAPPDPKSVDDLQRAPAVEQTQTTEDIQALFDLGLNSYNNGQFDEAIQAFEAVLEQDPSHLNARSNLGAAYFRAGDLEAALREFKLAHNQAEDDAEILYNLGAVKLGLSDVEGASQDFQTVQQLEPNLPDLHVGLGNIHLLQGDDEAAVRELQKAIELAPDAPWRPIIEAQIQTIQQQMRDDEGD